MAHALVIKLVVLAVVCTKAVPSMAAKRTFKFTKGDLPARLYEKDIGSTIEELQTKNNLCHNVRTN
ncbi:hypothetical protein DPMN_105167 [Dreissena polymorpha]|uniref:Uncharacterized protein n=1 Tax=Dreissena polymorpha TaxID=45954 RepID=A0A9D4HBB8_DREPO|nr:hypothetical protein DPMN_105167 [Dreissena polymorpha]